MLAFVILRSPFPCAHRFHELRGLQGTELRWFGDLLPGSTGVDGGKGKVVSELVLLDVRKRDDGKRGEQGRTREDGAVIDRVPYLRNVSKWLEYATEVSAPFDQLAQGRRSGRDS